MKTFDHTGKVIAVTGGSRGIGEAIVRRLCEEGAHVFATFNSQPERAQNIANEIIESGGRVTFLQVNVGDEESVKGFVEAVVTQGGRVDGLVNNAGITKDGLIMRMNAKDWQDVIDTNLTGVFYTCKAVARPMMSQRAGRIVNIGSIVGLQGNAGQVNYSSAKAGLVGLTKSLARELASRNVFVNCIAPGLVETDMTDKLTDEQRASFFGNIPMKRAAHPDEIASVVSFFMASESSYITGQVLNVDGGLAM
ncbi:MAG: 3-oxoacyl-[acyl-carrier-protein] reductase [Candidatus Kapabacteria bacterium]|nr:3-oxoacyl-[acyl-carrier-protein] reductase [Candidatus Kapabacteria bacterium]